MARRASGTAESPSSVYQPDKRTIGQLLANPAPAIIVPDWQRSYSWNSSNVEAFWTDLLDFDLRNPGEHVDNQEYFLGSIVVVKSRDNTNILLDGQQRIATSAILISVIRDYIAKYNRDAAQRVHGRYLVDIDDADSKENFRLTMNSYDRDYFWDRILLYKEAAQNIPRATQASHKSVA